MHKHKWMVFSTCLSDCSLMLGCEECNGFATVNDPTKEEWSEAFYAPSHPYEWTQPERVVIHEGITFRDPERFVPDDLPF